MIKVPIVALIGRANVGKSSLFNRVSETRDAYISPLPGTTRDINQHTVIWRGLSFIVWDTAGMDADKKDMVGSRATLHAKRALTKADLILFMVDGQTGPTPGDLVIAKLLRTNILRKPVVLVVNKIDTHTARYNKDIEEFSRLGIPAMSAISAKNGRGVGTLLDEIVSRIQAVDARVEDEKKPAVRVAFIGKPNVGKSSLLNSILGYERAVVSTEAHTTRDVVNETMTFQGTSICFLDTAGIRRRMPQHVKRTKTALIIEKHSVKGSENTMADADVVLVVIDMIEGITKQDEALVGDAIDQGRSIIIVANKMDALDDEGKEWYDRAITATFRFAPWAPVVMVSAIYGKNMRKLLETILEVYHERIKSIDDAELDVALREALSHQKPPRVLGKPIRFFALAQVKTNPPVMRLTLSHPQDLLRSYVRYIEHAIRKKFGFKGAPLKFQLEEYEGGRRTG